MAYITKRGNSYSVRYTYEDEHGKSCDKWESFPTKEEATNRKKQIEHELAAGTFLIPYQKSCSCGQPQEVHTGAHHLDGRGNAGGSGQHG